MWVFVFVFVHVCVRVDGVSVCVIGAKLIRVIPVKTFEKAKV